MNRFVRSAGYARVRGVFGAFFILFGLLIGYQILRGVGLRFEALPGVVMSVALIALGAIRIRAALETRGVR